MTSKAGADCVMAVGTQIPITLHFSWLPASPSGCICERLLDYDLYLLQDRSSSFCCMCLPGTMHSSRM